MTEELAQKTEERVKNSYFRDGKVNPMILAVIRNEESPQGWLWPL